MLCCCCATKKKPPQRPSPYQQLLDNPIVQIVYNVTPSQNPKATQDPHSDLNAQQIKVVEDRKAKKMKKDKEYTQQYPLYPPAQYREKKRQQLQRRPPLNYFDLIRTYSFNERSNIFQHKNEQEQIFTKLPMVRGFNFDQKIVSVSDDYIQWYYRQSEQQRERQKQIQAQNQKQRQIQREQMQRLRQMQAKKSK